MKCCDGTGAIDLKARRSKLKGQLQPDHSSQKKRLNRVRGQLEGIDRMIDEKRYCVDIITQVKAARSALKALENAILESHLRGCVQTAFSTKGPESEIKIQEIMDMLK